MKMYSNRSITMAFFLHNEVEEQINQIEKILLGEKIVYLDDQGWKTIIDLMQKVMGILQIDKEACADFCEKADKTNLKEILLDYIKKARNLLNITKCRNKVDLQFLHLYQKIMASEKDGLSAIMIDNFKRCLNEDEENIRHLMKCYNRTLYWGALTEENYELIYNRAEQLTNNHEKIIGTYFKLADYQSKYVLLKVILNWITFSYDALLELQKNQFHQYFDLNLVPEVKGTFIDAGACEGDTVSLFRSYYGEENKVYSYEITPDTYQELVENTKRFKNVICLNKGLSDQKKMMYLEECEDIGGNRLGMNGGLKVSVVSLDEDVEETIGFIKMDIEGAEYDALLGARGHITREHPILAISAYHNNIDIWRIPELVEEMNPNYKLYYRYYGGTLYPNDYVLYGIEQ